MEGMSTGRRDSRFLPFLILFLSLGTAFAQTPGGNPPGPPPGPSAPRMPTVPPPSAAARIPRENPATETLLFRIRSAFSLTPVMVASLQARGSDQGSASAAASGTAKSESAVPEKGILISWSDPLAREVPFSVPLDVRLVGKNVLAIVQLTPIETGGQLVNLLVQGQIWVQKPDGTLSFNTSFQSLNIALGSRLYFYPLGVDARNGAPIAVEIRVDRSLSK